MSSHLPCQIIPANYKDTGFGDPEIDFEDTLFTSIESDLSSHSLDFSEENLTTGCYRNTLYSNLGFGDFEILEVNSLGYTNDYDNNFSDSNLNNYEINKFVDSYRKVATYTYGSVYLQTSQNYIDVKLPENQFTSIPVINCTPVGDNVEIYISDITKTSFRINKSENSSIKVNYMASQKKYKKKYLRQ